MGFGALPSAIINFKACCFTNYISKMSSQDGNQDVPLRQRVDTSQLLPDYPDYFPSGADDAMSSVSATETTGSQEDTSTTTPVTNDKKSKRRGRPVDPCFDYCLETR